METPGFGEPAFEEFDPASDCDCPGCVHWRRVLPHSRTGRHPAAHLAVVLAATATAAIAVPQAAPAFAAPHAPDHPDRPHVPAGDEPDTPQGGKAPLHGPGGKPADVQAPATTRAAIIKRAKTWVAAQVPYSMSEYWSDGYRQDCSGFVSMAWSLPGNEWTGSLDQYGVRIAKDDLQPGDMLLFHNPADPQKGSHVVLFGGWTDYTHTYYIAYEETPPRARKQATPYAYWSNSAHYTAYRYKVLVTGGAAGGDKPAEPLDVPYPGAAYFGPGANNKYVTQLGRMLVERGAAGFYASGPGPRWTDTDRRATQAFQQAQGWTGQDADGLPGPQTWTLLVTGKGNDIRTGAAGPPAPSSHGVPGYPGRASFRPGANNKDVTLLGKQLVKKGFGKYYTTGPGPRWGEADRRAVEAFQRAQGWRGGAADGYPGPETWRRLFK
ncbi:peptidoglycan hydrolase-like protein with peptidoglycan-binding domain [Streptomyces sp. TLI_55]|uniref:peptidoglycan-binding protein n=1 Tax=Streptomyces sp. TLI_55 TaxID=1938861 RepID=UPI000BDB0B49|nr:peptidoglycan-binding protein [Streptomyces sp. TLI_55]SNX61042.1 peptidoglycan hydrolase-like protein with peptidoglycan-binding domain [Streptomyces sp. TLI_55]